VTDIERPVESGVKSMEGIESWPESVSKVSNSISAILDEAPAIAREISFNFIKEAVVVNSFISLHDTHLFRLLNLAEVLPV